MLGSLRLRVFLLAVLEAPAVIPGLDDLTVMSQSVE